MINTCFETTSYYHSIAYYSHLVPVAISILLCFFVLTKSKFSLLTKVFSFFVFGFCLWLLGDVVIWTNDNFYLITALWAPLDYINILFYLSAAYFFAILVNGDDIPNWQKAIILVLSLPAWFITVTGGSITGFNQPVCEAYNNDWLTHYKLIIEITVLAYIMMSTVFAFARSDKQKRKQMLLVGSALVLFLSLFASTEYIASVTGIYEMNLYSLFVLPIFLGMIIFSITNLKIFAYKSFGMQLLVYVLLIMVGSQFFFLENTTDKLLTLVTLCLSAFLSVLLARNIRREEQMAIALEEANEGQENLIHIMNHQIKGYLGKARNIFAELSSEPDYCPSDAAKPMLSEGLKSVTEGVDFIQQVLNGSSAASGKLEYVMKPVDFKAIVTEMVGKQKENAEAKQLSYTVNLADGNFSINADELQLKEAVKNLIDNSIRYTVTGGLTIKLDNREGKALFSVSDTGVGITPEDMKKLFTKGGRGKDSLKYNVNSTGYGLAFVKGVVEAHKGRVWVDSAGPGTGSTFYMELPLS